MNIFLSYSSEDRELADQVHLALCGGGYQVFFDRASLPPAGDYHARIRVAVDKSDIFVFLVSHSSVAQGSYALTELKYARRKWSHPKGRVLPVRVGDITWEAIPGHLKAVTVLEPEGNIPAEVLLSVSELTRELCQAHKVPDEAALKKPKDHIVADRNDYPEPLAGTGSPALEPVEIAPGKRALIIMMIHETGKPRSYTAVINMGNDLWYGQCFSSLIRGSLHTLLQTYSAAQGARFAPQVTAFLSQVQNKDLELRNNRAFRALLVRAAGEDPIMVMLQDQIVEDGFLGPARKECGDIEVRTDLGFALIADTIFHVGRSRYERIKLATITTLDGTPATGINEQRWLRRFACERIASFKNSPVATVVKQRTETYVQLMISSKWDLEAPVAVGKYLLIDP